MKLKEYYTYDGIKWLKDIKGYWKHSFYTNKDWKHPKQKRLHQYIWEQAFGSIPYGFHIHHKNHNRIDNRIENLELVSRQTHTSIHHKGKTISEKQKKILSDLHSGRIPWNKKMAFGAWNKGKKRTAETNAKIVAKQYKKITQFTKEGLLIKNWNSIKDAGTALDICRSNISLCLSGKYSQAGGFIWKYN